MEDLSFVQIKKEETDDEDDGKEEGEGYPIKEEELHVKDESTDDEISVGSIGANIHPVVNFTGSDDSTAIALQ